MALHVMDEAKRCLGCKVPRCQKGCPINTPIPEVIRLLKENKLDEAGRLLFENNPLTTVCSLVCNHKNQCEGNCVLGIKGRQYTSLQSKVIYQALMHQKWSMDLHHRTVKKLPSLVVVQLELRLLSY